MLIKQKLTHLVWVFFNLRIYNKPIRVEREKGNMIAR